MPDEIKEQKPPDLILQIRLTSEGFNVTGEIIKNEAVALWMLDKAKDTIKAYNFKQNMPVIEKPHGIMGFARHIFKK